MTDEPSCEKEKTSEEKAEGTPEVSPSAAPSPKTPVFKRRRTWGIIGTAGLIVLLGGLAWFFHSRRQRPRNVIVLEPIKTPFYHHEFVEWRLSTPVSSLHQILKKQKSLTVTVWKDGKSVKTIGNIEKVSLEYVPQEKAWRGRWPCPWNAPEGDYEVRLDTTPFEQCPPLEIRPFRIAYRPIDFIPPGFAVLTCENIVPLGSKVFPSPDGTKKGMEALAEWTEYLGADALWIQGGESGGYSNKLPENFPWYCQPLKHLKTLGAACHKRGVKFGVYVMSYLIGGPPVYSPDYQYGWDYKDGQMVNGLEMKKRRGISITDPKRMKDITILLKKWDDLPEVDFLGLDYIRPVFGGYELVEDFASEMPVEKPAKWEKLSKQEKMLWLAKGRLLPRNIDVAKSPRFPFIDKWFWYRAHRTGQLVQKIRAGLGSKKPLWTFTLSWEKGWQHGQDPVMMRDAGADMDAIMLYEADRPQFDSLLKQWNDYVRQKDVNLLVGDVVDWPLHQRTTNPAGPEEFYRRNLAAATDFHSDKPTRGIFIHDFYRAWRGRTAPYGMREWLIAGGAAITALRQKHGVLPYTVSLSAPDHVRAGKTYPFTLTVTAPAQKTQKTDGLTVEFHSSPDVIVTPSETKAPMATGQIAASLTWNPGAVSSARANRAFVAARVRGSNRAKPQFVMVYFQGDARKETALPEKEKPAEEKKP